jgi:hypothetical protein
MSSVLSAQYWDTYHLNVPTRKMIKQSSLKDKEAYPREDVDCPKEKNREASLPKPDSLV